MEMSKSVEEKCPSCRVVLRRACTHININMLEIKVLSYAHGGYGSSVVYTHAHESRLVQRSDVHPVISLNETASVVLNNILLVSVISADAL
jgi:hypothetical protein